MARGRKGTQTGRGGRGLAGRLEQGHARHVVVGAGEEDRVAGVHAQQPDPGAVGRGEEDVLGASAAGELGRDARQQRYGCVQGCQLPFAQAAVGEGGGAAGAAGAAGDEAAGAAELHRGPHAAQAAAARAYLGAHDVDVDRLGGVGQRERGRVGGDRQVPHDEVGVGRGTVLGVGEHHRGLPQRFAHDHRVLVVVVHRGEEGMGGRPVRGETETGVGDSPPPGGEDVGFRGAVGEFLGDGVRGGAAGLRRTGRLRQRRWSAGWVLRWRDVVVPRLRGVVAGSRRPQRLRLPDGPRVRSDRPWVRLKVLSAA